MSSDLHFHTTARNLVSVSGFGYSENVRRQQLRKPEPAAAPRIKHFSLAAPRASLPCLDRGSLRPC